ncbi:MAG: hypothetical protein A2W99_11315 [Bacteroidetes bacterium GWF2_33_16]|nr:MAG: hypothetical protein A2X00_04425 [Bacteroidetes bacterium GWE2_32_14]OFY04122.1 MAG: hypothetical protein A2W99_11315 [Bacteroidetes bacterium GWF2_33_16]
MSLNPSKIIIVLSLFIFMGFSHNVYSGNGDDQKKIEKIKELNLEAQKLIDKANYLYSEIAGYDDTDPNSSEKIEKLRTKALNYQVDALELQKEANFIEYSLLTKDLADLKLKYSQNNDIPTNLKIQEEQSGELFYKAEKLRNEAYQLDKNELDIRFSKLSAAQEYEKSGIESLKQLKDIYSGKQLIDIEKNSKTETNNDGLLIDINEELLQSFLNYLNKKDSFLTTNSYYNILYSDSLSASSIRKAWDEYLYSELKYPKEDQADNTEILINKSQPESNDYSAEIIDNKTDNLKNGISPEIIYKIQIASDKKPLPQHTLQKIYSGNKTVKMVNEDGWNKLTIGDFKSYSEAEQFRASLKVDDAFIVTFKDGEKEELAEVTKEKKAIVKQGPSTISAGLEFKVQIAAAKVKLSENDLVNIYKGDEHVDVREEEGWFKYSVGKFNTYEQATALNKLVNVSGSFVVAYKDGIKIPLSIARSGKFSETTSSENIVFKVQIAADRSKLTSENLHNIYSGFEKISNFQEDGWYKYAIGEYNNFADANELRKNCSVNGAFVIAFKGDKKMNVIEAKNATKRFLPQIIKDWIQNNSKVVFRVQIAASSKELSDIAIQKICSIEPIVYSFEENGWFKYSIGNFESYQQALVLKRNCGVDGAFIVPYINGSKVSIKEAIEITKK